MEARYAECSKIRDTDERSLLVPRHNRDRHALSTSAQTSVESRYKEDRRALSASAQSLVTAGLAMQTYTLCNAQVEVERTVLPQYREESLNGAVSHTGIRLEQAKLGITSWAVLIEEWHSQNHMKAE